MIRKSIMLCAALILYAPVLSTAQSENAPDKDAPARGYRGKFIIVPSVTGGFVTGDAGDLFEDTQDKVLYGFGIAGEYYIRPHYAVGVKFDAVWKDMSSYDANAIRTFNYAAYGLFRLSPFSRQSPYARVETGMMTGSVAWGSGSRRGLGSYAYVRLGIGLYTVTGPKTNTRIEVYYKNVRSEGHDTPIGFFLPSEIPFNVEAIGVELGIGVPI